MVHSVNMRANRPYRDGPVDVVGTGFTALDRIYADGSFTNEALGGSCGNVLVSLAMLRRQVTPVLALGDDDEGAQLVTEFFQAGATIEHIHRHTDLRSPVITQAVDTYSGQHGFSFVCPLTREQLPRYQPIGEAELTSAIPVLTHCSVFYSDRLSNSILEAMKTASAAGAIIFFEPSGVEDETLFEEALKLASILKFSADRIGDRLQHSPSPCIQIITHGACGLEVADEKSTVWCNAVRATSVVDTCGSGDMVSIGIIDWILANGLDTADLRATDLVEGVKVGQQLAAENCAFTGARGLFSGRGATYVRQVLDRKPMSLDHAHRR